MNPGDLIDIGLLRCVVAEKDLGRERWRVVFLADRQAVARWVIRRPDGSVDFETPNPDGLYVTGDSRYQAAIDRLRRERRK